MNKAFVRFILKSSALLLFVGVAGVTLFFAYGYRIDVEDRSVLKTSIIDFVQRFQDVSVFVNGTESTQSLPFQMKGILPGKHRVEVRKNGFYPWARDVLVEEDIVTIVEDVLLIPENVRDYAREILRFTPEEKIVASDRYILALKPGSQVLSIIELGDDGLWTEEEIGFYRPGFTDTVTFPGEKFLLNFDDGLMAYVNFPDRIFKTFALKEGVQKLRVDSDHRIVTFLDDGDLYGIPFDNLGEEELSDAAPYLKKRKVMDYEPESSGNFLFLAAGMLFEMSADGADIRLIDQSPGLYTHLSLKEAGEYSALVLRDQAGNRRLLIRMPDGGWRLLTFELKGQPLVHPDGFVLYATNSGDVALYDITLHKDMPVTHLEADFEILGWFNSHFHYLVREGTSLRVRDIFDVHQATLLEQPYPEDVFVAANTLYTLEDGILTAFSWEQ